MPREETVMHTIEIAGRPTVVVNASEDEVQDLLTEEWFKLDLMVLETESRPLWFGHQKDFSVRRAFEEEISKWEAEFSRCLLEGHITEDDRRGYIVYLVPVTDPTDDDEDEEDDSLDEP